MKRFTYLLLCYLSIFVCPLKMMAQADYEKEKEIRSGNYFYGESIENDPTVGKTRARNNLMMKVAKAYLNNQIANFGNDSALMVKEIMYHRVAFGLKIKTLAYVQVKNIDLFRKKMNIVELEYSDATTTSTKTTSADASEFLHRNLLDTLIGIKDTRTLETFMRTQAQKNRLTYTNKETLVTNENKCNIICLDPQTKNILAFLSTGNTERKDLLSDKTIANYKTDYKNAIYIWVLVY